MKILDVPDAAGALGSHHHPGKGPLLLVYDGKRPQTQHFRPKQPLKRCESIRGVIRKNCANCSLKLLPKHYIVFT